MGRPLLLGLLFAAGCGGQTTTAIAVFRDVEPGLDASDEAATDATDAIDTGTMCLILASKCDQTGEVDSDCINVSTGDPCADSCSFSCGAGGAISVKAGPRYETDLQRTGYGSGPYCECPPTSNLACCRGGVCMNGVTCRTYPQPPPPDEAGTGADACPAGEVLCGVGCSGGLECFAPPCPPTPPCPPPVPPPDDAGSDAGSDAGACPAGEMLCYLN